MNGASAVSAASRNGVAPISLKLVLFKFRRFVIGLFRSAPWALSRLTRSRLVIAPDPSGDGSLSPTPDLRTLDRAWSAVYPGRSAFGSAPAFSSSAASSKCPFQTATSNALEPAIHPSPARQRLAPGRRSLDGLVDVGARLQESAHDAGLPFPHGEEQRSKSRVERRPEIGAGLDELFDGLDMAFCRCPHQRRLSAPAFRRVHVGAAGDECPDHRDPARARRGHQRGFPAGERRVWIGAGGDAAARRWPRCRCCRPATAA